MKLFRNSVFRDFHHLRDITKPEYRHALLMLFWLIDLPMFFVIQAVVRDYTVISCPWDYQIPFIEEFVIFYILWFPYYMGTLLYLMLYDPPSFRRGMYMLIAIFTITKIIYFLLPNGIDLRPDPMPRDNIFTRTVLFLYGKDRSMNCCPSEHVLAAVIAMFMAFDSDKLSRPWIRALYVFLAVMICASVLFIKQHSLLDIAAAVPFLFVGWLIFFRKRKPKDAVQQ